MESNGQNPGKAYSDAWKIVEGHLNKGLPKSALEEVQKIYNLAKKEKQEAQLIKAVVYMIDLQNENREDNLTKSMADLENEIADNPEPAKSILTSLLAKKYNQYYQSVRWNLYGRTATAGFKKDDVATWGTADFHDKISALYLGSIREEAQLKRTLLEPFNEIIVKGNVRKLRPTLFDLLAHEALQYFSSDERNVKKPSYAFEISTASAFDPAADFIHRKFETRDSTALEFQALKLYQKLIAFHADDREPDALIDADIQRLQYVRQKSVHPDADTLYFMSVSHLADQYQNTPAAAQAWYLTAAWHDEKGSQYQAGRDSSKRYEKMKAVAICEKIIRQNPGTEGGINAYNLLVTIRQKSLQPSAECVNVPDKPFRVLVKYKNLSKLYLRLIRASDGLNVDAYRGLSDAQWRTLTTAAALKNWEQSLPDTHDHQEHGVEIKVAGLPVGVYMLLAATGADFNDNKNTIAAQLIYVSSISYVQKGSDFFVLDRDTGQPLARAGVQVWESYYDYSAQTSKKTKGPLFTTDTNGYFKKQEKASSEQRSNELFEITHGKDRLFLEFPVYTFYRDDTGDDVDSVEAIYLFTDRSLYRPGQTVFYKGIVRKGNTASDDRKSQIEVALFNANSESVAKVTRTVNDYGSFSGSFTLPQNALNGQFYIAAKDKYTVNFHVEEYKRPKFSVEFDTLAGSYKVGDAITVTGAAAAYAGNAIDGAKVSYRVVRNPRFIYPWLTQRWWLPPVNFMEIAHGEGVTDGAGKFSIAFTAVPDLKINQKVEPVFDYTIYTDITDINGETRSGEMRVSVGYKSLVLKVQMPEKMAADSLKNLDIRTENMNGTFVASDVKVKIVRLAPENRLIRTRLWERPDVFVMSKAEYISAFPNDEYDGEGAQENWPDAGVVLEKEAKVLDNQKFIISQTKFKPGFYRIEISSRDQFKEEIKDVKYIELTDPANKNLNRPQYVWAEGGHAIEPGEKTSVKFASSADHLFVISGSDQKSVKAKPYSYFSPEKGKTVFEYSATEADRGGYGISYMFVRNNRVHQYSEVIHVPWTNKALKIEYITFRNKTLPGSQEKWTLRISGYKKEKVAAEMLAGMYDASLDQFYGHQWEKPDVWRSYTGLQNWNGAQNFTSQPAKIKYPVGVTYKTLEKQYDNLIGDNVFQGAVVRGRGARREMSMVGAVVSAAPMIGGDKAMLEEVVSVGYGVQKNAVGVVKAESEKSEEPTSVRKNFNENAFFIPDLLTDKNGEIEFSFTMPEALTRWKFQALAHTKGLALGYSTKEIVTQKDLMVQPNAPRFLREGDQMDFSAKVVNLSANEISGTVTFQLFDAETNEPIDAIFNNKITSQPFTLGAKESRAVRFPVTVPGSFSKVVTWRIVARAGNVSDGEENFLPVLSNRTLVTETLPVSMRSTGKKQFKFEKLIHSGTSKTLVNQSLVVEYTGNPAWYAVQALPYLMTFPHECAEQTWNRYYANSLAAGIVGRSPRIAQVFETWRTEDTTALLSNLQKNQELKSVLLEETPWVLAAKTESQQKKNVALLFDLVRMGGELDVNFKKLKEMAAPNGGIVWFKGGPDDRYITQYILTGIGHLKKLNAIQKGQEAEINTFLQTMLPYLDIKIKEDYDHLIRDKADLKKYTPGPLVIQYLYMRSFFQDLAVPEASKKALTYFRDRAGLTWVSQSKYMQGLIALALHRTVKTNIPAAILKSLKETAVTNDEMGMYWKDAGRGWWWYEAPVERQSLLIEAFQEIANDNQTINDLKTWLLKNKQTNNWESTKATAEACYALMLQGNDWLSEEKAVSIQLGQVSMRSSAEKQQAGTGYFQKKIDGNNVVPEMGNITVTVEGNPGSGAPSWGAVYWQYFEDMDKITTAETPLKLTKKLFLEKNTDKGPVLTPVNAGDALHVGDKIKVRIELRVDREMEYVHMKDLRASALEPVNVLSSFKYQGGLGYYESTKDAGTHFFFNYLNKGTYVFEYPLFVTHNGDFGNGITTIQCMYAPEFTAHSEGVRIRVADDK